MLWAGLLGLMICTSASGNGMLTALACWAGRNGPLSVIGDALARLQFLINSLLVIFLYKAMTLLARPTVFET